MLSLFKPENVWIGVSRVEKLGFCKIDKLYWDFVCVAVFESITKVDVLWNLLVSFSVRVYFF